MTTNGKCLFVTQVLADRVEEGIPISEIEYDDDVICTVDLGADWETINAFLEEYSDEMKDSSYLQEDLMGGRILDSADMNTVYYFSADAIVELADTICEITEEEFQNCMDLAELQSKGIAQTVDESEFDVYCETVWETFQELAAAVEDAADQSACALFYVQ